MLFHIICLTMLIILDCISSGYVPLDSYVPSSIDRSVNHFCISTLKAQQNVQMTNFSVVMATASRPGGNVTAIMIVVITVMRGQAVVSIYNHFHFRDVSVMNE